MRSEGTNKVLKFDKLQCVALLEVAIGFLAKASGVRTVKNALAEILADKNTWDELEQLEEKAGAAYLADAKLHLQRVARKRQGLARKRAKGRDR